MRAVRRRFWSWLWLALGTGYFLVPLYATAQFSLGAKRGTTSLLAYTNVLAAPRFAQSFTFSLRVALATIVVSVLLIVPTAYWVHLRLPRLRTALEFCTLLPFVVPAVVLVFGLIRAYNRTPLTNSGEGLAVLLVGSYVVLSLPYMYRAVDNGLRAVEVVTLTEAAQSLGASWFVILRAVILPNVLVAVLSGAFVTFAIVMGEFTIAFLLAQPGFGPYMNQVASSKVYEPSALAILSFALTWVSIALIQLVAGRISRTGAREAAR